MNKTLIITSIVLSLALGVLIGKWLFSPPPIDPNIDVEERKALLEAQFREMQWRDSAEYYKSQADTVFIERTKLKTVTAHVKALNNASLDTLQHILMLEPRD